MVMQIVPAMAVETKTINYVALGDSVAAGVIRGTPPNYYPDGSPYGYTDDIANALGVTVNEQLCVPGWKSGDLVNALGDPTAKSLLKNANIVTLDIGANDLLQHKVYVYEDRVWKKLSFYDYVGEHQEEIQAGINIVNGQLIVTLDPTIMNNIKSILTQLIAAIPTGLGLSVQKNIETILKSILKANPNAKIYVMGYYNPLPLLSQYGMDLTIPIMYFNTFIYRAIWNVSCAKPGSSITYVDTMTAMAGGLQGLLYPLDIHPTAVGYKVIAGEFMKKISLNLQ